MSATRDIHDLFRRGRLARNLLGRTWRRSQPVVAMPLIDQRLGARSERRGAGLSPTSPRSGGSRDMIHKVECGNSSPTASLLAKLSGYFRLSMSTLLARVEMNPERLAQAKDQPVRIDPESGYVRRHSDACFGLCVAAPADLGADLAAVVPRRRTSTRVTASNSVLRATAPFATRATRSASTRSSSSGSAEDGARWLLARPPRPAG